MIFSVRWYHSTGFLCQGCGSSRNTGVTTLRSWQKIPPCPTEPEPASFRTHLLLAKAESMSGGGSPSGIMYLRDGRREQPSANSSTRDEDHAEAAHACPWWRRDAPAGHGGARSRKGGSQNEVCGKPVQEQDPGRALQTNRERSACWSRFPGSTCDPPMEPMLEKFMKKCSPWKARRVKKFVKDYLLWEGSHTGIGKRVCSLRRKLQHKKHVMNWP